MIVVRIVMNALIMGAEVAAVAAVAAFGYTYPFQFAAITALLSLCLGISLEGARLRYEAPFYFGRPNAFRAWLLTLIGAGEALVRATLVGIAALFTFSGTNSERLYWVAIIFGLVTYVGCALLRRLANAADASPTRWGYFRAGHVLGLLFSAGLTIAATQNIIAHSTAGDIGWRLVWEIPAKPSISQISELVFQIKQAFDGFVVTILSTAMSAEAARVLGILLSINVLTGLVAALYAALITSAIQRVERFVP